VPDVGAAAERGRRGLFHLWKEAPGDGADRVRHSADGLSLLRLESDPAAGGRRGAHGRAVLREAVRRDDGSRVTPRPARLPPRPARPRAAPAGPIGAPSPVIRGSVLSIHLRIRLASPRRVYFPHESSSTMMTGRVAISASITRQRPASLM